MGSFEIRGAVTQPPAVRGRPLGVILSGLLTTAVSPATLPPGTLAAAPECGPGDTITIAGTVGGVPAARTSSSRPRTAGR